MFIMLTPSSYFSWVTNMLVFMREEMSDCEDIDCLALLHEIDYHCATYFVQNHEKSEPSEWMLWFMKEHLSAPLRTRWLPQELGLLDFTGLTFVLGLPQLVHSKLQENPTQISPEYLQYLLIIECWQHEFYRKGHERTSRTELLGNSTRCMLIQRVRHKVDQIFLVTRDTQIAWRFSVHGNLFRRFGGDILGRWIVEANFETTGLSLFLLSKFEYSRQIVFNLDLNHPILLRESQLNYYMHPPTSAGVTLRCNQRYLYEYLIDLCDVAGMSGLITPEMRNRGMNSGVDPEAEVLLTYMDSSPTSWCEPNAIDSSSLTEKFYKIFSRSSRSIYTYPQPMGYFTYESTTELEEMIQLVQQVRKRSKTIDYYEYMKKIGEAKDIGDPEVMHYPPPMFVDKDESKYEQILPDQGSSFSFDSEDIPPREDKFYDAEEQI